MSVRDLFLLMRLLIVIPSWARWFLDWRYSSMNDEDDDGDGDGSGGLAILGARDAAAVFLPVAHPSRSYLSAVLNVVETPIGVSRGPTSVRALAKALPLGVAVPPRMPNNLPARASSTALIAVSDACDRAPASLFSLRGLDSVTAFASHAFPRPTHKRLIISAASASSTGVLSSTRAMTARSSFPTLGRIEAKSTLAVALTGADEAPTRKPPAAEPWGFALQEPPLKCCASAMRATKGLRD